MYTPFANLSDDEVIMEVLNKVAPTDLELELMLRLDNAIEQILDLQEESAHAWR